MERLSSGQRILKKVKQERETQALRQQKELRQQELAEKKRKRNKIIFARRLFAVSLLIVGLFTVVGFAQDLFDTEKYQEMLEKNLEDFNEVEVTLYEGDTAWDIQAKLLLEADSKKNVNDVLVLVEYINDDVENFGDIKAGKTITFLVPKQ